MKAFVLLLGALAGAGLLYVATAGGSQQAPPTAGQFAALKKQVAKLQKDLNNLAVVTTVCLHHAVPEAQFGQVNGEGYVYQFADKSTQLASAFNVDTQPDANTYWMLDVGQTCASAINSGSSLASFSGLRLSHAPARQHSVQQRHR